MISRVPGLAAHALEEQRRESPMRVDRSDVARLRRPQRAADSRPPKVSRSSHQFRPPTLTDVRPGGRTTGNIMTKPTSLGRIGATVLVVTSCAIAALAQASPPQAGTSVPKAVELSALLQAKKLEAFAMRDPVKSDRFVAALLVPKTQLLLVSATYTRPMDIEYRLYNKDFMGAYVDLNTSMLSTDKFFVEDMLGDGLVAIPLKNAPHDAVKMGTDKQTFNGDFADPRRRNQPPKISQEDYLKKFGEADQRYAAVLAVLIEQLKKPPVPGVDAGRVLR